MQTSKIHSCLHACAIIFFGLSAYVQINDPDPEVWVIVYVVPAFLSLFIAMKPQLSNHHLLNLFAQLVSFSYAAFASYILLNSYDSETSFLHWCFNDETGREFGGLLICSLWIWLIFRSNSKPLTIFAIFLIAAPVCAWICVYFNKSLRKNWPQHCQTIAYSAT